MLEFCVACCVRVCQKVGRVTGRRKNPPSKRGSYSLSWDVVSSTLYSSVDTRHKGGDTKIKLLKTKDFCGQLLRGACVRPIF